MVAGIEEKRRQQEEARKGAGRPGSGPRRNSAATSKEEIMRENAKQKYGEDSGAFVNEDAGDDKPLVMNEEELINPPDND